MRDEVVRQTLLFQRLRWNLLRNSWNVMIRQSRVKPLTILLSSLVVWVFVFVISWLGFRFLVEGFKIPPDEQIISILLGLLFFSLGVLLVFSSGVILYASLFDTA